MILICHVGAKLGERAGSVLIRGHEVMATGIFFYYQAGQRLRDFPQALDGILAQDNVFFFDAFYTSKPPSAFDLEPIPLDLIHKVHAPQMVKRVMALPAHEGALYSAAGTVAASQRIARGEIENAFVFTGYGDHHAGRNFFGGGCYLNGAALAVREMRDNFGLRRFAIIDTDAHHGDGTWDLFADDPEVLYICLCSHQDSRTKTGNVNVQVPLEVDDEQCLSLAAEAVGHYCDGFNPDLIFWNWGYDGTMGDYGDLGLTPGCHAKMAEIMKRAARKFCGGRLICVLCGGSRRDLAKTIIPQVIRVLAD